MVRRLWWCSAFLLAVVLCQNGAEGAYGDSMGVQSNSSDVMCGGSCDHSEDTETQENSYYYDSVIQSCQPRPTSCNLSQQFATFTSLDTCLGLCNHIGGCGSTAWGCCPDGETPKTQQGNCPKDEGAKGGDGSSGSGGTRWDLVASGVCTTILLLGIVTLIAVATYAYKHKNKQRQRRYIQEVLQMYHSTEISDSSSDSSYMSDNPEHNNLFDRL